eukprot:6281581-Ditylum_brightwellii.AAC.1
MSAAADTANGADPAIEYQWGWGFDMEETMEEGPPEEVPMEVDKGVKKYENAASQWQTAKKHEKCNEVLVNVGEEEEKTEENNNQKTVAEQIKECGKKTVEAEGCYKTTVRFEWKMP